MQIDPVALQHLLKIHAKHPTRVFRVTHDKGG